MTIIIISSIAPELISGERGTNLIDVYSFGCIVNEIMSEKQCYHDCEIRGSLDLYIRIRKGMRPSIDKRLPKGM